jgi:hypothetical protein
VEKGHLEESGLNPLTVDAQRRSEFMSIYRRAAQAKGINNQYTHRSLYKTRGATTGASSDWGTTTPGKA